MYKLPINFDLDFLSGCYLEMVSFGSRITRLEFSRPQNSIGGEYYKIVICVEGNISYQVGELRGVRDYTDATSCSPLIDFILQNVVSVEQLGLSSLKIILESSDFIMIEADGDSEFESYTIELNSGELIVV